ncbi:transposase-like protein [Fusarium oxysporum f. sp. phaseoli]
MTRSLCTLPRRVNFAVNKTWHQRQDVRLATTLYTGERLAGDFDALPHATFSLCVLATVSTKDRGQAARGGFGRGAAPNPTIEDLPKVVWKNRRFVQEDSLARKGAKGRKSWIRSHGMFFIELNHQDQPIGHVWCCSRCDTKGRPEFFSVQATSSAADHLRKYGSVLYTNISHILTCTEPIGSPQRITPASQSSPSDDSAIDLQSHATPKRPRLDQSIILKAKVKAVQELSVGFVIDSDVPFTIFEHKFLKELFYQFDHELALQIPWSSSSITRELQKFFESKADIIKAELGSALTKIHISFDLWTSPNRLAIMAVFAHFIDKFGNQQSRLLALRRQLGIHSGENLAETLFEIVQLWDIRGQVGTVISDNVTTNNTCLSYFYRQLDPSIRPADIKARRMRCYGHLESDINGMRGLQEQDLRHWRSKGPIGKLHNIVKFIRSSPQRSEYFKRIAHEQEDEGYHLCEESTAELEVILNNETRWNSTYMMIERALRKQTDIRAYIFALEGQKDEEKRIPADDILSNEDWRVLGEVNEILTPLYHQTMRTQGWGKGDSHGRLWEVLVGMEYLLEHFEDWKGFYNEFTTGTIRATNLNDPELIGRASAPLRGLTSGRPVPAVALLASMGKRSMYPNSEAEYAALDKPPASKISQKSSLPADHRAYIRASINSGWKKLDEYYSKLGESPLFAAAVILHPRFGISWLEATWATEEQLAWVRDAKAGIKDYFARWYQSNQRTDDLQSKSASSLTNRGKEDDHYTQWINSRTKKAFATSSSVSEMDKYLRLEPQDTQEPIQWWRDHKPSFPVLSSFALDVFAIPAMATDCERQFSLAKLTLTSQRLAMGADTLERVHCLRNWVRHGGVKLGSWVGN